jgi:hypothetical protein
MLSNRTINLLIIFGVLMLIGFSLARAIAYKSTVGIILSIVSLGAVTIFIYYLTVALRERDNAEPEEIEY